ncbi:MAG: type III secretion system chaperone [Candidatus Rhabdochlamydia sp.]
MLEDHIAHLFEEQQLDAPSSFDQQGVIIIPLPGFHLRIIKKNQGAYLVSTVAPLPQKNQEFLLVRLMQANFLGQGTGQNVLGLGDDEATLTLSLYLSSEMSLDELREGLEQIANYTSYWKDELAQYEA